MGSFTKNSVLLKQFSEMQETWADNYMKFRGKMHERNEKLNKENNQKNDWKLSWKIKHCIEEYNKVFQQQTQASRRKNQWTKR